MTRLLLVRHGATSRTAEDRFSGATGVELSDEGRSQVAALAERLSGRPIRAVYASPLSRARETAQVLTERLSVEIIERDGLREISHGHWEGFTRREVELRYPEEYAAWEADPFTFAPDGGESGVAVLARALPVVREIVVTCPTDTVLVVSHDREERVTVHHAGDFTGEINMLSARRSLVRGRMAGDGAVIAVDRDGLRALVQRDSELSEPTPR